MARQGKIARLPHHLREKVNQRLLDGETAREILAWLNSEKDADTVWWQYFEGAPANPQNLSEWRTGGYREWLRRRHRADNLKTLSSYAMELAKSGGSISEGAAAIAAGQILETLEVAASDEDADLGELTLAVSRLRKGDLAKQKIALDKRRESNREKQMLLDREKFETLAVKKFIAWAGREEAQAILNSPDPEPVKVDHLRQLIWGDIADK